MSLLRKIKNNSDLKKMSASSLDILAAEIRKFLIENISQTGGHLASSLGTVELTIALHRVFDCPKDKIIWDVGHQAYAHKILTGRMDKFRTLRQYGGISGFPRSDESECDAFNAGHASNSISAALGYAYARDLKGEDNSVIAVIGDGAMSGGLAFEAINNASHLKSNLIVILNNNEMSISKNVGGLSHYLNKLRTEEWYFKTKKNVSDTLKKMPVVGNPAFSAISAVKSSFRKLIVKSPIFDELGFTCIGPVDGHNIADLIEVLNRAKEIDGPVMIHTYTKKGKGYKFAEDNPQKFHGIGKFDIKTGEAASSSAVSPSKIFGDALCDIAEKNNKVIAITAAMPNGTGLDKFAERFPKRFFDVGIAEGHAVTFAGGLAKGGMVPVVAIYSTFLQRAYDNIFHDLILQKAHAVIAVDRAGLVGEDGETHHGIFDISYLSAFPNISILAPSSPNQIRSMLDYAVNFHDKAIAIRYPRAFTDFFESDEDFVFGKACVVQKGSDITVVAEGNMVSTALFAARLTEKSVEVIDVRTIKPVDTETLLKSAKKTGKIITVEDNTVCGGLGSIVENAIKMPVEKVGYKDILIPHGNTNTLYREYGTDAESLAKIIERMCAD